MLARNSDGKPYKCKQNWREDCFVQCGEEGLVLSKDGDYFTAFFEAFPKEPKTFIRGEGNNIEEAELNAWNQLQRFLKCKKHEFERSGYTNGSAICKHCKMFKSKVFEPTTKCTICEKPTNYISDKNDNYYCEEHEYLIPDSELNSFQLRARKFKRQTNLTSIEDIINLEIEDNIKDILIKSFKSEKDSYFPNKGKYAYLNSPLKLRGFFNSHKYISSEKIQIDDIDLYMFTLEELDSESKNQTGRFIKLFSTRKKMCESAIKHFKNK